MRKSGIIRDNKPGVKMLSAAALASVVALGAPALASESIDLSAKPIDMPTLDYLHNQNPDKYHESAYTLTRVNTAGDNTITKYEYNSDTQTLEPVYYEVHLKNAVASDNAKYGIYVTEDKRMALFDTVEEFEQAKSALDSSNMSYSEFRYNSDVLLNVEQILDGEKGDYVANKGFAFHDNNNKNMNANFIGDTRADGWYSIISNYGELKNIQGDFIGNSNKYNAILYNNGKIGNIVGDFIGNQGSAMIWNGGYLRQIDSISGNFIANAANSVISNGGYINRINGDFIGNLGGYQGAAIENQYDGQINSISGRFIANTVHSDNYYDGSVGGAIYNSSQIGSINADFINNKASQAGGAIFNNRYVGAPISLDLDDIPLEDMREVAVIKSINGNFIGNKVGSEVGDIQPHDYYGPRYAFGGAIANRGEHYDRYGKPIIGKIDGAFISNSAAGDIVSGGAIYNFESRIGDINADFAKNSVKGTYSACGGAITNAYIAREEEAGSLDVEGSQLIGDIKGDFVENTAAASGQRGIAYGGAIFNGRQSTVENWGEMDMSIEAYELDESFGGFNDSIPERQTIGNISGDFIRNGAYSAQGEAKGGAIYTESALPYNDVYYVKLTVLNDDGSVYKVLYNLDGLTEEDIKNMTNYGSVSLVLDYEETVSFDEYQQYWNGSTEEEYIDRYGLLENLDNLMLKADNTKTTAEDVEKMQADLTLVNTNMIGNYAKTDSGSAEGGAVYSQNATVKFIADDGETKLISGNYTEVNGEVEDNAIYMNGGELIFDVKNRSTVQVDDKIDGAAYSTFITGDSRSKFVLNNNIKNTDVNLYNTNLHLTKDNWLDGNDLVLHSGAMSMVNGTVGISSLNNLTVVGDTNFAADVDLANQEMDRFTSKSYGAHTGNLNISGMNLLSDAKEDKTEIFFAEKGLKDNVTTTVKEVAYTPIYKYTINYDNRNNGGYFVFNRGAGSGGGNASDNFNPGVLSASVAGVAASQATINETFKYVFEHADAFTQMPSHVRLAKMNANKYAISTDFNENIPFATNLQNKAGWFRPYVTFEKMDLKNGPKVNATTYGSLAGFDTDFFEHKNGWHSVGTGYIGYNGSQLRYKGIDTSMNGGLLGYTHTMYKGNFWSALTLSAGASVGTSHTMYGKEDFTSLMAGVGSKTGYNFEFKEGKYILQPIMFMSYTFVNTFDYTNAAGVKINADPAHSIQLNPSVRFIANTKNGWQPYASVGMVWNVMNENKVTANSVRLPEMSMKPYVEYGVGVQRNWKDRFTAFGQAMIRNGGRTGIALTGGFRWAIGREGKPIEKVQSGQKLSSASDERKIIKQMSEAQKVAFGKMQNTSRTVYSGNLKQI